MLAGVKMSLLDSESRRSIGDRYGGQAAREPIEVVSVWLSYARNGSEVANPVSEEDFEKGRVR